MTRIPPPEANTLNCKQYFIPNYQIPVTVLFSSSFSILLLCNSQSLCIPVPVSMTLMLLQYSVQNENHSNPKLIMSATLKDATLEKMEKTLSQGNVLFERETSSPVISRKLAKHGLLCCILKFICILRISTYASLITSVNTRFGLFAFRICQNYIFLGLN